MTGEDTPSGGGFLPFEAELRAGGVIHIAGVDEVGRGCLAGPVVAAAVILPPGLDPSELGDSKQLSAPTRERMDAYVRAHAVALAVGEASVAEIDELNILKATLLAMQRAVAGLLIQPDHLLVDGNTRPPIPLPTRLIVQGDARCLSIAAASVVAKVYRDALMDQLATEMPEWGFEVHKGYGTAHHREMLARFGPTPHHRRSFRGVGRPEDSPQLSLLFR